MREIKFRLPIYDTNGKFSEWRYWGFIDQPWGKSFVSIPIDPATAQEQSQQYTGLKDKNGKEVYEGDVTNYGVVEWCECLNWDSGGSSHPGFYFRDKYEYGDRGSLDYHVSFDDDIEVIGNIIEVVEV